jgi:hypothetical protein
MIGKVRLYLRGPAFWPLGSRVTKLRYDFTGKLDGVRRTPQGGIEATARLTRSGVFVYQDNQGNPFRELRSPEEIFQKDSLETLKGAPLTIGHPKEVNTANWQKVTVGHVGDDIHQDGIFVAATVRIQDAQACAMVESGDLSELSCGYSVDLEMSAGEYEGEHYDAIQRNPKYNHVAMGGIDWGRAGNDVRLYLDAYASDAMATPNKVEKDVSRTDAPVNGDDGLRKDLDNARADLDKVRAERDDAKAKADKAEAERDEAKKNEKTAKDALEASKAEFDARVDARVSLITKAKEILDKDFVFAGKSDKDIRVAALKKADASFSEEGKTDGYIEARFDLAIPQVQKEREALSTVNETVETANADAVNQESPVEKARRECHERHANAWKAGKK